MTGRNFGAASVVWQVIWPILLYSFVTTVMALLVGARLDVMWILLISAILTSGVLYYFYSRRRQTEGRHYGPSWRVRLDIGTGAALLFVLAASLCVFLNNLIEISGIAYVSEAFDEVSASIFGVSVWLQILAGGFAAPVVEELIFRGMGYGRLRGVMGIIPAAILSSLLFALYHGNLVQAVYGFLMGLVLAVVYEHFDGLVPAIWLHVCANLTSIALTALSGRYPSFFGGIFYAAAGTAVSGLLVWGCLLMIYDRKRRIRK
ncbi:MAG: lysostaphin resistance A-like protein [[Clostridium] symbiosum]